MSIKFKLTLVIDLLVLAAVTMFGGILYTSEKAFLLRQSRHARENVLQSLANVSIESVLSQDDAMLISYTADLKRIVNELETAYVLEGRTVLAHTDKRLAPRQLPLSYSGARVRARTDKILVRAELTASEGKNVSFSRKRVVVNNRAYDVAVGYSDLKVRAGVQAALDSVLVRLLRAGALVVLAATLLSLWFSGLLTRPIKKLVKAFYATGGGDLDYKLQDSGRRDEIGVLNREFNRMTGRLKELDELKKDFVSSVTHELKSPLGAIESYLDLMSYEISQSRDSPGSWPARLPKFLENISFVKQNSQRLLCFIGDLLDAAKIEKGKFEISKKQSQIEPIIGDVVKLFQERARASEIYLTFAEPAKQLPPVRLDADRISQVLVNLTSNAVKYTPKGGKVTITASVAAEAHPAAAKAGGKGPALRVSVEDTGIGISRADLDRVFEKFYQVDGVRHAVNGPKGTGLGLYIVKAIVEAHGGRAFAESSGAGSSFGFELPLGGD